MLRVTISALALCVGLSACAQKYPDQRPAPEKRLFVSEAVEAKIAEVAPQLTNPKLRWMFMNCFPNTISTPCGSAIPVRKCGLMWI